MILIEFPIAAFLKGSILVAALLCLLGVIAYLYVKPFTYLKEKLPSLQIYFFGAYVMGAGASIYRYNSNFSTDAAFGLFLLINLLLLPFMYRVKKEIENHYAL
jgi:hypothetical protein